MFFYAISILQTLTLPEEYELLYYYNKIYSIILYFDFIRIRAHDHRMIIHDIHTVAGTDLIFSDLRQTYPPNTNPKHSANIHS